MSWETHEVSIDESYIVLVKHGQPLYVVAGPFIGSDTTEVDKKCEELNKDTQGACKHHVATRSRYIELEVRFE